ncbi:MAG TPA: maleylpyruvate isomerase family mycothiol-dependent enzyme [Acidimicrobiales bacterium]|nr:maleylpyruvate isomerase family mycothiol-dependent enzyme [Acidimicrobiales bacterium]
MLDASSLPIVLDAYGPERTSLLTLLGELSPEDWSRPTECPAYDVKGVATHVLGDDLSLLSRQRDAAEDGLSRLGREMPGAEFRTLLDTFNDRWVAAAAFLSTNLVMLLLRLTGEWTEAYYRAVDPEAPGESVGLFGARPEQASPFWQAIAREYFERWIHHAQIRRALGLPSPAERRFLVPGIEVVGAIARMEPIVPGGEDGAWAVGPMVLGPAQQAADILTRGHTAAEIAALVSGPTDMVGLLAAALGR